MTSEHTYFGNSRINFENIRHNLDIHEINYIDHLKLEITIYFNGSFNINMNNIKMNRKYTL